MAKDLDLTLQDLSPDIEIFEDSSSNQLKNSVSKSLGFSSSNGTSSSSTPAKPVIVGAIRKSQNVGNSQFRVRYGATSPPSSFAPSVASSLDPFGDNSPSNHIYLASRLERVDPCDPCDLSAPKAQSNSYQPSSRPAVSSSASTTTTASTGKA